MSAPATAWQKHKNELASLRQFWDTSVYPGFNVLVHDNLISYARNQAFLKINVMDSEPRWKK
jgi:hypothetical protein